MTHMFKHVVGGVGRERSGAAPGWSLLCSTLNSYLKWSVFCPRSPENGCGLEDPLWREEQW